jgi:3-oxoacyl-[acyl-carrier-protein] synthase-3
MTLKLVGSGIYLPEKIVHNDQLPESLDTSHEWIFQRTGICQRHISSDLETCAFMATIASKNALEQSGLTAADLDLIIVASTTQDVTFPSVACLVQNSLGCKVIPAFDLQAVCAGFVFAISVADSLSKNSGYKNVLLIGVERMSLILDWQDRSTCVLFGDGAGAAIFRQEPSDNLDSSLLYSDGSFKDILYTTGGIAKIGEPNTICMNGREVFKHGVQKMAEVALELLEKNGLTSNDIAYFVAHQANVRMIDAIAQRMGIEENKVVKTTDKHANCSAASIPLALNHLVNTKNVNKGDLVLTVGFGAGASWGANLIKI